MSPLTQSLNEFRQTLQQTIQENTSPTFDTGVAPLANSLVEFRQALKEGYSITFDSQGNWGTRWTITQIVRRLLGWEKSDDLATCHLFQKYLKRFEIQSSKIISGFNNTHVAIDELELTASCIKERLQNYVKEEKEYQKIAKAKIATIKEQLANLKTKNTISDTDARQIQTLEASSAAAHRSFRQLYYEANAYNETTQLDRILLGFKYRKISQNTIHSSTSEQKTIDQDWLKKKLVLWKQYQFPPMTDGINRDELNTIDKVSDYPELIALIRENYVLRDELFKFVFKSTLGNFPEAIDAFVQLPSIQKKITKGFLDKRMRRISGLNLRFSETQQTNSLQESSQQPHLEKDVTLRLDYKKQIISLKNMRQVVEVRENDARTVGQIIKVFKEKDNERGDLECAVDGIFYYRPEDPIPNIEAKDYYKNLKPFDRLTRQEVQARYPQCDFSTAHAMLVVKGSRSFPDKDKPRIDGNHSWFQVVVPIDNDNFVTLHPGKYAEDYPQGFWGTFFYIFNTLRAIFTWDDEQEFYYHKEHEPIPIPLTLARFERLMDILRKKCLEAQAGGWIFQAQGDNCSPFVQEVLDELYPEVQLPRLFEVGILETANPFPINYIVAAIKAAESIYLGKAVRIGICTLFGAWRGCEVTINNERIVKRLVTNPLWLDGTLQLPAMLFRTGGKLKEALAPITT